jgi:hypothetical protein
MKKIWLYAIYIDRQKKSSCGFSVVCGFVLENFCVGGMWGCGECCVMWAKLGWRIGRCFGRMCTQTNHEHLKGDGVYFLVLLCGYYVEGP